MLSGLASAQQTLGETEARLDKARLAQSVAELAADRDALRQEAADLNAELQHKQPLLGRSISVNQELRGLDEQLRALTMQRDDLAAELQQLVGQLAEGKAELAPEAAKAAADDSVAELVKD